MNNEMFCINLISQISECLGLNPDDRSKIADVVYKVTHFYIIDKKEDVKEGNIKSYIDLYINAIKIEGLAENTVKNKGYCLNEHLKNGSINFIYNEYITGLRCLYTA